MRKLHEERQVPADDTTDAKLRSHSMFQNSFRSIKRQNNYRKYLGDLLELWHSIAGELLDIIKIKHCCVISFAQYNTVNTSLGEEEADWCLVRLLICPEFELSRSSSLPLGAGGGLRSSWR